MEISNFIQRQYSLWRSEVRTNYRVPIKKRYPMLFKGFYRVSNVIYDLEGRNHINYLSDYDRLKTRKINGPYAIILKSKILFEAVFKESLPVSLNIAIINKSKIIEIGNSNVDSFPSLIDYLKEKKAMVLKPITGSGGLGIMVVKWDNDIFLNNERISKSDLEKKVNGLENYFVNEYIEQGEYGKELNESTLNTIRIITMLDVETGEPFIPIAVQRIGNKTSSPTDNWTQGGLSCNINLDTGELSKGVIHPKNNSQFKLAWYENHPDNGEKIKGKIVPNWELIKGEILKAVREKPFLPYVGWDVVVTDDGFKVIEGNSRSDVNLLQVHKPLLKDDRVKKFYEHYNVL